MKNRLIWIVCLICGLSSLQAQQNVPYKNPLLPTEVRVNDLLQRMMLKEKIAQICHLHSWDVFDGQQLNKKKLAQMCVHGGYGFFEGFPLTATESWPTARAGIRPDARSSSSRATLQAARPRWAGTRPSRPSFPSGARCSTWKRRGLTRCMATKS